MKKHIIEILATVLIFLSASSANASCMTSGKVTGVFTVGSSTNVQVLIVKAGTTNPQWVFSTQSGSPFVGWLVTAMSGGLDVTVTSMSECIRTPSGYQASSIDFVAIHK